MNEKTEFTEYSQKNTTEVCLGTILAPLPAWFRQNKRSLPWRKTRDPYCIWVSEIMLQQTRVAAAEAYYLRFIARLPNVAALAAVSDEELMQLWAGLGYYSRARNLRRAAQSIVEQGGTFPRFYDELLKLPGIGPYTAGAVASIAFGQPVACVDGNVLRVLARLLADSRDIALPQIKGEAQQRICRVLESLPPEDVSPMNQGLMELGALICIPKGEPRCEQCPLRENCLGRKTGMHTQLPKKSPKKPRQQTAITVLLLYRDNRVAVEKRPPKGLLAGLWQYPNLPGHKSPQETADILRQMGLEPLRILPAGTKKHIFTHVEWEMIYYKITVAETGGSFIWADAQTLREHFALPSAFLPPEN